MLAAVPAVAQTTGAAWRPFRVGHTYFYAAGAQQDSLIPIRLDSAYTAGADSAWRFAPVIERRDPAQPVACPPSGAGGFDYQWRAENELGSSMRQLGPGTYTLSGGGAGYELRCTAAPGATWPFGGGLTATLTRRDTLKVGGLLDSVAVIGLTGGHTLVVGKRTGWVSGPSLRGLRFGVTIPLRLLAVPGLTPALPPTHAWRIYDFQPGDEFGYVHEDVAFSLGWVCRATYERVRVLSRQLNAAGTVLTYRFISQRRTESNTSPTNPGCPGPITAPVTYAPQTLMLTLPLLAPADSRLFERPRTAQLSGRWSPLNAEVNTGARRDSVFMGCWVRGYVTRIKGRYYDTCARAFGQYLDVGGIETYLPGYGLVSSSAMLTNTELRWFSKNGVACGSPGPFAMLLSTPALLPAAAVQLFPNPATTSARLLLTGLKSGPVALTATDALGRRVWAQTQTIGPEAEVALPVGGWAPGVYYVRVSVAEGSRVVRLVRE